MTEQLQSEILVLMGKERERLWTFGAIANDLGIPKPLAKYGLGLLANRRLVVKVGNRWSLTDAGARLLDAIAAARPDATSASAFQEREGE